MNADSVLLNVQYSIVLQNMPKINKCLKSAHSWKTWQCVIT